LLAAQFTPVWCTPSGINTRSFLNKVRPSDFRALLQLFKATFMWMDLLIRFLNHAIGISSWQVD
jgi:hypothetical protein